MDGFYSEPHPANLVKGTTLGGRRQWPAYLSVNATSSPGDNSILSDRRQPLLASSPGIIQQEKLSRKKYRASPALDRGGNLWIWRTDQVKISRCR